MTTALILSGGGARAAYQVGVLKAVAEILPQNTYNPFPIVCGTSAGAINTLSLAGRKGSFPDRVAALEQFWQQISAEQIYQTSLLAVAKNTLKILGSLLSGSVGVSQPMALLDNRPLRRLLTRIVDFHQLDEAIASRYFEAVAITAMSYGTGQSITFFQGNHENWQRARRMGLRTGLTIDHLMASAALPTIFPPVKIGNRYFGDGALRQLKPLSPALHLGASRLFVIGVSDNSLHSRASDISYKPPSIAQMMGHMLNSAFIDTLESDLETLRTINCLAENLPPGACQRDMHNDIKKIDYLCITPSRPIHKLAADYSYELPKTVRLFLRLSGGDNGGSGSSAASYLLFESGFCNQLISLGYRDALNQEKEILQFFMPRHADVSGSQCK